MMNDNEWRTKRHLWLKDEFQSEFICHRQMLVCFFNLMISLILITPEII